MTITISNRNILSVTDLNKSARRLLEGEFPMIFVEGEISNFSTPASGHWYFTLKDSKAQLRCAMFRGSNSKLRFVPRNGLQVVVRGRISLYEGRGEFQMIAEFMEEAGDGALRRAFETLKNQLQSEGLFETSNKQTLPVLAQHLAIITSPTGAAVRDVLHILKRRFPALSASIIPVQVQGEESVQQIVDALSFANRYKAEPFDAILLTRGGGSLEDLWSFNTEPVARAIAASRIPVVAAIGHETDTTIADFVADFRAPTPSAAAEILSPDGESWLANVQHQEKALIKSALQLQAQLSDRLKHIGKRLRHPGQRLQDLYQRLDDLEARLGKSFQHQLQNLNFDHLRHRLHAAMKQTLSQEKNRLKLLTQRNLNPAALIREKYLEFSQVQQALVHQVKIATGDAQHQLSASSIRLDGVSPLRTLNRGYAIVSKTRKEKAGKEKDSKKSVIRDVSELAIGDEVEARVNKGSFIAKVTDITKTS